MHPTVRERLPELRHGGIVFGRQLAKALRPVEDLTVSDWADRHRVVAAESGSPHPGPWRTARVPYLREPMDCLHPDHPARRVSFKASAQVGKSEVIVNWFGVIVDRAPGSVLIVLPSLDEAIKFNRTKLQPTIDASPTIRHRVKRENSRDEGASTTSFKRFAGGFAQIVTASSSKGLQAISIRYLCMDEVSEFPFDVDGRGDPIDQARARQFAYGDLGKELACSTPGIVGRCRITAMVEAGDDRRFYLPCPHCGAFQTLALERMHFETSSGRAVFHCGGCGAILDEVDKAAMLAGGRWVPTFTLTEDAAVPDVIAAEAIDAYTCAPCEGRCRDRQPSYSLWAAYSPMMSWTDIWRRRIDADEGRLSQKAWCQQTLGEAYDAAVDAPDWEKLLERRSSYPARTVPPTAPILTGACDVNGTWLDWAVWAHGPNGQSWIIDRGQIVGDPATPDPWIALAEIVARTYPTGTGRSVGIDLFGVDVNYLTPHAYAFVRGRPRVVALIGKAGENLPLLGTMRRADTKDEVGRVVQTMHYHPVGTHAAKSLIMQGLRALIDGPDSTGRWPAGTMHLSAELVDAEYVKQLTAESLVERELKRTGHVVFEWVKSFGRRNEALDLAGYCRALAWHLGVDAIVEADWRALVAERIAPAAPEQHDFFVPRISAEAETAPPAPKRERSGWLGGRSGRRWI